jgi:TPR repeat protein
MHYNGIGGLNRDPRKAFELYNQAADGGSKDAWRNLAAMYYSGDGVPKSEDMAREIMKVIFNVKPPSSSSSQSGAGGESADR